MALSEEEKLVWLGMRQAQQETSVAGRAIDLLQEGYGDFATYETAVDGFADYAEHETDLTNNGFDASQAERFTQQIQNRFDSWGGYQTFVTDEVDDFEEMRTEFGNQRSYTGDSSTADGSPSGGMQIHDEGGVTYNGVEVPPGAVEIFGTEVHFSEQEPPQLEEEQIEWSNLQVSDQYPDRFEEITVSATVENTGSVAGTVHPQLKVDHRVHERGDRIHLAPTESETVEFKLSFSTLERVPVTIGPLDPITVAVEVTGPGGSG